MSSNEILIIHPGPLGNHSSTLFYCKLLANKFKVTYVGIDEGNTIIDLEGINSIHLPVIHNSIIRKFNYFKLVKSLLIKRNYKFILLNYFPGCSFFLLFNSSIVVEIRSSYIFSSRIKRFIYNFLLSVEVRLFRHITTLSLGLIRYLRLPSRTGIVPLGGPLVSPKIKDFNNLNFLYVGTFRQRNIPLVIEAFGKFVKSKNLSDVCKMIIVGFGSISETLEVVDKIKELQISDYVTYLGEVRYPELQEIFDNSNIGISYIPKYSYYNFQPPTKTFEYLLNGMPVLATSTFENNQIIKDFNGILVDSDIDSLMEGFETIYKSKLNFSSLDIQNKSFNYSWEFIVENILIPYINKVENAEK